VPSAHNKPLGFVQNNFPNRIEPGDLVRVGLANRHAGILARRDVFSQAADVARGTVLSDAILLRRIVGNLLSNAVKYTQRGGVLLAARAAGGGRRIEVWDTGVGIAPVHQREIFREFYKVPSHAGTEDGFGLGLYIVARLSAILGHPLSLASRPGRGTVFRLMLQPSDARQAADRAAAFSGSAGQHAVGTGEVDGLGATFHA
jgi:signal transduction histidine kinase